MNVALILIGVTALGAGVSVFWAAFEDQTFDAVISLILSVVAIAFMGFGLIWSYQGITGKIGQCHTRSPKVQLQTCTSDKAAGRG